MRIKKWIAAAAALLLTVAAGPGTAEGGVTLRTISCFAGLDGSAGEYVAILQQYESRTGNTVLDSSATSDEAWKTAIMKDFAAGNEPDILFFSQRERIPHLSCPGWFPWRKSTRPIRT